LFFFAILPLGFITHASNRKNIVTRLSFLYSSHDLNIIYLLTAFDLMSWQCQLDRIWRSKNGSQPSPEDEKCLVAPIYASLILWELYHDNIDGKYYIQLIYNDKTYSLCGGPLKCDYQELKDRYTKKYYVADWNQECGMPTPAPPRTMPTLFLILSGASLVLMLVLFGCIYHLRSKLAHLSDKNTDEETPFKKAADA